MKKGILHLARATFALAALIVLSCQNPASNASPLTPQEQVQTRWNVLKPAYTGSYYSISPSIVGPGYATGTLASGFLPE